jgi:hypothetical protein
LIFTEGYLGHFDFNNAAHVIRNSILA